MNEEFAIFLGCITPTRVLALELTTRKVFQILGFRLLDMEGAGCCGSPHIEGLDHNTWEVLGARNICIAEEMGKDIVTPCPGCAELLDMVNQTLKSNDELKDEVNEILADAGRKFKGTIEVNHALEVLSRDEVLERIKGLVKVPLKGIRAAVHYGCHVLKPSNFRHFDDPINPKVLDGLIESIGATSVPYTRKMQCCGSPLRGIDDDLSLRMMREKLINIKEAGANCMVMYCPACHLQYDMGQVEIRSKFKEDYDIPIFHLTQLLGLALGIDANELGFEMHKIKVDSLLNELNLA